MDDISALGAKRAFSDRAVHEDVYHSMRARDIKFDVDTEYNTADIFVGASMRIQSSDDVAKVQDIPGVKAVRPVGLISPPKVIDSFTVNDPKDSRLHNPLSTHIMTGVDKLHAQGIFGEGIKIGIIDSGIDYTHPALGGAMGAGHKIVGGYDFVGDNFNGSNTPEPDDDPMDSCSGHGTHVAGIIGADPGHKFGIRGVAYKASIFNYRVTSCGGTGSDQTIVSGMIRAYEDGMDIINISIGGVEGWSLGTVAVVANRLAKQGLVVIVGAGNTGDVGSWYASNHDSGVNTISVGSIGSTAIPAQNLTVLGVQHDPIPYIKHRALNITGELPIYATSNDTHNNADACQPLPDDTPDLSGYVVVIGRGNCTFDKKMKNSAQKGGKLFLIYNSDGGAMIDIDSNDYTVAMIPAADGRWLVEQFVAGAPVKVSFPKNAAFNLPDFQDGGIMSHFSSYGPTYDMYFSTAVSAPGGGILSTMPLAMGEYAVLSGTSMSAPFVAGAAALVLESRGKTKDVARSMRDLFQSTAQGVRAENKEGSSLQTVSQQGAGLINVDLASKTKTIVTPAQLMLNDTAHFNANHTITIQNTGFESITYQLSHVTAGTALSIQANKLLASKGPVPLIDAPARVHIVPSTITVPPGSTSRVSVSFRPPRDVDESSLPVYSGFIKIASHAETLQVTYLGVAGDLKKKVILDPGDLKGGNLPVMFKPCDKATKAGSAGEDCGTSIDSPTVVFRLAFGSPLMRLDLVDKNIDVKPTIKKRGQLWPWADEKTEIATIGSLIEHKYAPRNTYSEEINPQNFYRFDLGRTFANKTRIENGQYRFLLRVLKVTGDPRNASDYESWLSPVFLVD